MQFQRIDQAFWTGIGYDVGTAKPVYEPGDLTPVPQDKAGNSLAAIQTTVDNRLISAHVTYQLFNAHLMGSQLTSVALTVKPSGTRVSFLPKVMVGLWTGVGKSQQLTSLPCTRLGEQNGWITFEATVPSSFANKAITGIGLTLKNASAIAQPLDLNIGQMRLLNQARSSGQPHVFYFQPQQGGALNWIDKGFNSASTYNIYGYLGGKYYLLGTTPGYSYNTEGIILNRSMSGFTKFAVQEVNAAGDFKPLSSRMAHFG
jgi:hypothetical protein